MFQLWYVLFICIFTYIICEPENITTEPENITTESENITAESENVVSESDNIITELENVITESENIIKESENISTESEDITAKPENIITERVCYNCGEDLEDCRKVREDMDVVHCANNCQTILKSENELISVQRGCDVFCPTGPGIKCKNYTCDVSLCNNQEFTKEEITRILDTLDNNDIIVKILTPPLLRLRAEPSDLGNAPQNGDARLTIPDIITFPPINISGVTFPTKFPPWGKGSQDRIYSRITCFKVLLLELTIILIVL